GTKDILPSDISKWKFVESVINKTMGNFNYSEIRTPVFEETALFCRGIGEATDIVSKEMYTFTDKGGTSLTLRPEMTASVVRAFIEHSMAAKQNLNKLYYIAPMFRQERPQAGRLRQFHQFGAEALGSASPALDAELITIAYDILKQLGLKNLTVKINSLGTPEARNQYKSVLRSYLSDKLSELSEESRKRFETNILRIFDSKEANDIRIMDNAPRLPDYLDEESASEFRLVRDILERSGIPFEVDAKLVRGLDYYTKTTFEIVSSSVGSQSALCGGGRYDLLVEQLGGKPVPAVGFAAGIERILLACENEKSLAIPDDKLDLYIIRLDESGAGRVSDHALALRRKGLSVEVDYLARSVKAQMREANRLNARFAIILGGSEFEENKFTLKNMADGTQELIAMDDLDSVYQKVISTKGE
ncbi:MAG: histidine--tRNA ligase, partial [Bacteroidota bacterium]